MPDAQKIQLTQFPFPSKSSGTPWGPRTEWPAHWIQAANPRNKSTVTAYRLDFTLEKTSEVEFHVTADQRYWLYLDDMRIGRGSERGTTREWYYESYRVRIPAGAHQLRAIVWHLCASPPWAQVSVEPGFLLAASTPFTEQFSTGIANWQAQELDNVQFLAPVKQVGRDIGCGERIHYTGMRWLDVFSKVHTEAWKSPQLRTAGNNGFLLATTPNDRILHPGRLPSMRAETIQTDCTVCIVDTQIQCIDLAQNIKSEAEQWHALLNHSCDATGTCATHNAMGKALRPTSKEQVECGSHETLGNEAQIAVTPITIAPYSTRRILIDLNNYYCAYSQIATQGGAGSSITIGWAERLSTDPQQALAPEDRLQLEGHHFVGVTDRFTLNASDTSLLEPLWWQAGRFVQITISTAEEALTIKQVQFEHTGYPLKNESNFHSNAAWLNAQIPVAYRTLQACAQETYTDCPYWEQLQYIGDTRIQALITYLTDRDVRLIEKGIHSFALTMTGASPFPACSAPSSEIKIIAPFALWWIGMLHDYGRWHGDSAFIRKHLPTAWWIVDHFLLDRNESGLICSPQGWNYVDSTIFPGGEPKGAEPGGVSGILNWQLVLALNELAELSQWLEEPERAEYAKRLSRELATTCEATFWNAEHGAIADDSTQSTYSEHSQALALLSGHLSETAHATVSRTLVVSQKLLRAGPYFTHYICEAYRQEAHAEALQARLQEWSKFIDAGFYTFPEEAIVGRSDCHAWSSHPLYHAYSSIAGIRPRGFGFDEVEIRPQLGSLRSLKLSVPWRDTFISLKIQATNESNYSIEIQLPNTLRGVLLWHGEEKAITAGTTQLRLTTST